MNNLDLIEQLEDLKYHCQDFAENEMEKEIQPFTDDVKALDQAINELRWIPVDEKLPSEEEWVLVTLANGSVDVLRFVNIEKFEKERNVKIGNAENFKYFWDKLTYWCKFNEVVAWKRVAPYKRKEQE